MTPLTPEIVKQEGNAMVLSMGPQHPSTHGVLQIMLEIEGESVIKAEPEIGYLHTGIEKTAENLFWSQAQTVIERMDYLAPESNALCYALAVEKLLGISDKIPERAQVIRVMVMELTRIASHCVSIGTHGIDLGAISIFFYLFDLRENILDLAGSCPAGRACIRTTFGSAASTAILPDGLLAKLDALIAKFPGRMRELRGLLQANPIFQDRTIDVGYFSPEEAIAWNVTGPTLRGSGIALRRAQSLSVQRLRDVSTSTFRPAPKATHTRASWCGSTKWTNRCGSSNSAPASGQARPSDDRRYEDRRAAERDDRALDGSADPSL